MPAKGQLKNQKLIFIQLICEMLTSEGDQSHKVINFKLRSDALWRDRWEREGFSIPEPGTIKNYVSEARKLLNRTGSERPWSILASSNPRDDDFIPATDLPLILEIWRIWLARGNHLTLRQARWISRLRHVVSFDVNSYWGAGQLLRVATRYASREAALGRRGVSDVDGSHHESHDLDAEIAFAINSEMTQPERNAIKVSLQAANEAGFITSPSTNHIEWLWSTEKLEMIFDEVGYPAESREAVNLLPSYAIAALSGVMISLTRKPEWDTDNVEPNRRLVEQIVGAIATEDWESVADLSGMQIKNLNEFETSGFETETVDE